MDPGERVDLIKGIADRIADGDAFNKTEVDLIFEQFGFGYASFGGDPRAYALEKATKGTDEQIAELSSYLNPVEEKRRPDNDPGGSEQEIVDSLDPWQSSGFKLFVSHCTSHAEMAGKLRDFLDDRGINAFVAHESIEVTQEWEDVIRVGLKSCDAVLAILTPNFKESDWTEQELGFAVANQKLVVPLKYGQTPHGFITKYQALTIRNGDKYLDIARKIFEALARHERTRGRMAEVLVDRFVQSWSYDMVRERFPPLKLIPHDAWTEGLASKLRIASAENREIKDGQIDWRPAPDVVEELLAAAGA
jgi:hypothetical protein